jgi:hypothetical protein
MNSGQGRLKKLSSCPALHAPLVNERIPDAAIEQKLLLKVKVASVRKMETGTSARPCYRQEKKENRK